MRAAFGLVGLLITVGVVVVIWHYATLPYTQQVMSQGQMAQQQAEQLAGIDSGGGRVSMYVDLQPYAPDGGKIRGLKVIKMMPGSSYQSYYGLAVNDIIEQIGPQTVRDIDDGELAKSLAMEAYQRQWELGILRNNQRFTLPSQKALAAAAAGPLAPAALAPANLAAPATPSTSTPPPVATQAPAQPAAPQPTQPPPPPPDTRSPLQRQLDNIREAGGAGRGN